MLFSALMQTDMYREFVESGALSAWDGRHV